MKHIMYRMGKKVGVIRFDMAQRRDYLDCGRIVARKIKNRFYDKGVITYQVIYAVRFSDGHIEMYEHDDLWSKVKKGEEK